MNRFERLNPTSVTFDELWGSHNGYCGQPVGSTELWCWGELGGFMDSRVKPRVLNPGKRFAFAFINDLFICAADDTMKELECFGVSGDDYYSKPYPYSDVASLSVHHLSYSGGLPLQRICWVSEGGRACCDNSPRDGECEDLGLTSVDTVVPDQENTCVLLKDGEVVCRGDNPDGEVGVGDREPHVDWVRPLFPVGTRIISLAGRLGKFAALDEDGDLWMWGVTICEDPNFCSGAGDLRLAPYRMSPP